MMRHRILACLLCMLLLCSLLVSPISAIDLRGAMMGESYTPDGGDVTLPYRIYLPDGVEWSADGAYTGSTDKIDTVLIWLHDEDLRGDDNTTHISDEDKEFDYICIGNSVLCVGRAYLCFYNAFINSR